MTAHAIDLADARAALEQFATDGLLVLETDSVQRQGQQGRAASGDETKHRIVGRQSADQRHEAPGRFESGRIRDRMGRLNDFDAFTGHRMPVAGHDQAGNRLGPVLLDHPRHFRRGFARPDDHQPAGGSLRQIQGNPVNRLRRLDCCTEDFFQQFTCIVRAHRRRPFSNEDDYSLFCPISKLAIRSSARTMPE